MDEDDDDMVTFELEAAEALAGIGRLSQGPAIAGQQCRACTSNTVAEYETVVQTAGYPSKGKSKQSTNKAEKEARRLRRILANRESARETIRRRKEMHLELIRKEADLSEEHQKLNKAKELAVAELNSLNDRNMFLKTQMAKIKKAETVIEQEEAQSCHGETPNNNPPLYFYNHPSLVPCFLSSVDIMRSSQFLMPHMDTPPSSHRGQENPIGPVFILPVPWMLPFVAQTTMFPTNDQCSNHTCSTSETLPHQDNDVAPGNLHGAGFTFPQEENAAEHTINSLSYRKPEHVMSPKKQEDVFAATEARRRRKELMKLKK